MKHIYYKNDFAVEITLLNASGEVVTPPDWEWHIEFTDGRRKYICSVYNGNAKVVGNTIMCYLDNHKFCCGEIGYKFVQAIPDLNYLDGFQNLITPKALPIELWEQESDNDVNIQSSVVPAYVVYDAYMTAKANGYTGTAEDFYDALIHIVDINTAEAERVEAEANRVTAEQQRVENFIAMESALTTATSKANTATTKAEEASKRADNSATAASQARVQATIAANGANAAAAQATQAMEKTNDATELAKTATANANASAVNAGNAATEANEATKSANDATEKAKTATTAAEQSAERANDISADLEAKREADYWRGAKGEKGEKGDKGDQGEIGLQGVQGVKGDDGVSPTVSTSKTGKVTTIEITDVNGVHTATVNDGDSVEVVQSTGTSTTAVMSQNAVSDKLNDLQQKIDNADADVRGFFKIENVFLVTTNKWYNSPSCKSIFYPVNSPKAKVKVVTKDNVCIIAFLKSNSHNGNADADYSTGTSRITVDKNTELETIIPTDAKYIYISVESDGTSFYPAHVFINDIDILSSFIEKLANIKRTIFVGNDEDCDYASITKAINEAYLANVRNIIVKAGTYDIISEYKEVYGETFFENYSEKNTNKGIVLKNGINIIFSGNSKVVCKYTGGNEKVMSIFSPFNSGEKGFVVDGLNIESKNVRYCFHDERLQSEDSYFNTYRNCKFKQDNTQSNQTFRECICGGLGKNGHVIVDSCEFESVGLTEPRGICTYHNTTADSGRSFVLIKNCYFHGFGSTYIHYAGTSPDITTMVVSGCSFEKSLPLPVKAEGSFTVENVELIEFNNSIVGKEYLPKEEYTKDKDAMLAEISKKQDRLNQVSTENVTEEDNFVAIQKDDGTDVVTVDDNNVTISGNLVVNGKEVITEISKKQDKLIAGDNITINNNCEISALSKNIDEKTVDTEGIVEDEQIFSNDDETEEYVKIGKYGIKAKSYLDINGNPIKAYSNDTYFEKEKISPISMIPSVVYEGDSKSSSTNYIVNAVIYPNGVIIAARANATIVKIDLDGTESTLLTLTGKNTDWRGLFMDSSLNVYASPHASLGSLNMTDRGLYKLSYGESSFKKVISLYDTSSDDTYETQENDDTIWTMCEDADGYLYAGVYCHTKRYAARIYRSTDKGDTWVDYYDFKQILPTGHHVHCITYNPYNNSLYAIIGEINTIIKSTDHGTTWTNLNAKCEGDKGTAMIATPTGMIIGSDGAYELTMSKLLADDKTVVTCGRVWANTCFGTRRSDVNGWVYAFGKIDSSVNSLMYMPPLEAITDSSILESWKNGTYSSMEAKPQMLSQWQSYHDKVKGIYPEDCIRPQHFAILVSKDDGNTWEVAYREKVPSTAANGIWCVGTFRNGECVCGRFIDSLPQKPLIISDGKHCYNENGIINELFNKIK